MESSTHDLVVTAAPHPDPRVHRAGFGLDHPYLEQCWGAVLGPTGVAILRRLPTMWAHQEPVRIPAQDLGRSLGLGGGTGPNSRFRHSLDRTVRFRLADWIEPGRALRVYTEVPPLDPHRLAQLPDWSRNAHDRLLTAHLDQLTHRPDPARQITDRLERLQHPQPSRPPATPTISQ